MDFLRLQKCPNCGKKLNHSLIICTNCGTAIVKKANFLKHLLFAFLAASVLFPMLYFLFFKRIEIINHPINLAVCFVGIWYFFYMLIKFINYFHQKRAFNIFKSNNAVEIFTQDDGIRISNIEKILFKIVELLKQKKIYNILDLIIFERIRKSLYFLKAVPSRTEILSTLSYQQDIDYEKLNTEFSIFKVFNWALPTLGFFGTVVGISRAIGHFSGFLQQTGGSSITAESIKSSLTEVLVNLALAFNSTMIALFILLLMLPLGAYLENIYNSLLSQVEEYCLTFITPNLVFDKKHKDDTV